MTLHFATICLLVVLFFPSEETLKGCLSERSKKQAQAEVHPVSSRVVLPRSSRVVRVCFQRVAPLLLAAASTAAAATADARAAADAEQRRERPSAAACPASSQSSHHGSARQPRGSGERELRNRIQRR